MIWSLLRRVFSQGDDEENEATAARIARSKAGRLRAQELPDVPVTFGVDQNLPRPAWQPVFQWIERNLPEDDWNGAYHQVAQRWLHELAETLGAPYRVATVPDGSVLLLSAGDERERARYLKFIHRCIRTLTTRLPIEDFDTSTLLGPVVVLSFAEHDEFVHYVAHFYPESDSPQFLGGALCLHGDYVHVAMPWTQQPEATLAHELLHAHVASLPLPRWLNEGLAQYFERIMAPEHSRPLVDAETTVKHRAYWDAETIKDFWTGEAWERLDEGVKLAYSLAEILVGTIERESKHLADFVYDADRSDAGQAAAQEHLGLSLGEIAATFLGRGDWEPDGRL